MGESMGESCGNEEAAGDNTVAQTVGPKGEDLVAGDPRSRPTSRVAEASYTHPETLCRRDRGEAQGKSLTSTRDKEHKWGRIIPG